MHVLIYVAIVSPLLFFFFFNNPTFKMVSVLMIFFFKLVKQKRDFLSDSIFTHKTQTKHSKKFLFFSFICVHCIWHPNGINDKICMVFRFTCHCKGRFVQFHIVCIVMWFCLRFIIIVTLICSSKDTNEMVCCFFFSFFTLFCIVTICKTQCAAKSTKLLWVWTYLMKMRHSFKCKQFEFELILMITIVFALFIYINI